jgi:hypothetical protein
LHTRVVIPGRLGFPYLFFSSCLSWPIWSENRRFVPAANTPTRALDFRTFFFFWSTGSPIFDIQQE